MSEWIKFDDKEIDLKVKELRQLERERDEIEAKIEQLKGHIKEEMTERGVDVLNGDDWTVTWKEVTSSRFDQSTFKEAHPELFESFKVTSASRRFLIK